MLLACGCQALCVRVSAERGEREGRGASLSDKGFVCFECASRLAVVRVCACVDRQQYAHTSTQVMRVCSACVWRERERERGEEREAETQGQTGERESAEVMAQLSVFDTRVQSSHRHACTRHTAERTRESRGRHATHLKARKDSGLCAATSTHRPTTEELKDS